MVIAELWHGDRRTLWQPLIAELVALFWVAENGKFEFMRVLGPKPGGAAGNWIAPRAKKALAEGPNHNRRVRWGAKQVEMLLEISPCYASAASNRLNRSTLLLHNSADHTLARSIHLINHRLLEPCS